MKTLLVVGHPRLGESTTQQFLKAAAGECSNVTWHELQLPFEVTQEQALIQQHDRIIVQFPLYWYSAPAVVRQWFDEVWRMPLTTGNYRLLRGKQLGVVVTAGAARNEFQAGGKQGATMDEVLRPYQMTARVTEMEYLPALPIYQFNYLSEQAKQELYITYQSYISNPEHGHFAGLEQWLLARLDLLVTTMPDLAPVLAQLRANQEELTDIAQQVKWMRQEDDE